MSYSFGVIALKYSSLVIFIFVFARGFINYLVGIYSEEFIMELIRIRVNHYFD
jgi:hypothetical protein